MAKLQNTYEQPCAYCHQDFVPVKRGTQRFCSASCRTTHCKKKKAGTLGRITKLKGPGRAQPAGTFMDAALASATGALAANAVSQTTEYFAVTQGLIKQVEHLTRLVERLTANHTTATGVMVRGHMNTLVKMGLSREGASQLLNLPLALPKAVSNNQQSVAPQRAAIPFPALGSLTFRDKVENPAENLISALQIDISALPQK